jgi:integrase/recombinase XerD
MTITLAMVATKFLDRAELSPNTVHSYEMTLLPFLRRYGRSPIEMVTEEAVEAYLASLTHLAPNTHNRHRATIRALFNFAVEQGYLAMNAIAYLKSRRSNKTVNQDKNIEQIRYLTSEQLSLLYHLVEPNSRLHTLILFLHQTGANISEILALDLDQINLGDRCFEVINQYHQSRWCFYGENLARVLEHYLQHYRHSGHSALFTAQQPKSKIVSRLHYRTAYRDWVNLISQNAELKGCRLQDIRHTFAMERVEFMAVQDLQILMGHDTVQTTLRYYNLSHKSVKDMAQEALKRLGE